MTNRPRPPRGEVARSIGKTDKPGVVDAEAGYIIFFVTVKVAHEYLAPRRSYGPLCPGCPCGERIDAVGQAHKPGSVVAHAGNIFLVSA